ncbi:MAG: hypothetical protein UR12_C0003G0018 [candidate division TM6 bacterium GW2011_GWF2_30_66]|jgi:hypothetical protein|nr:MAG: hypothetical protein UR12_C0003G0018 [candidate division TM6 bacterium GW2011_GWF2_30_66]
MKNFKLMSILSLALLFSLNSQVIASKINCCCNNVYINYYSFDNKFCAYKCDFSNSVFVENVSKSKDILEFRNLVSFSFSKDSKFLLVERSEYNSKIGMQNDFIEIFDLANEKRIFFMPFYKKCYPANYYSTKSYDLDDLVYLNFYGNTLESVEFDFEGNYIFVPANLYNVRSVYASQLGLGLSVKFNDGSIKVYIPTKDFSGFNEVFSFGKSILESYLVH